ncbi:Pol polyprotein [Gossypium australe]|uniref:Pol polyprotein n=1 Tax=Gossypium australe TaxID=47621 RepID=A0A5B6VM38_9ROSI|nr:Pol polyprotein [Gossypium australe]
MRLILNSFGNQYIFLVVDYVPKWVEVVAIPTNDTKFFVKFLRKKIFSRFRAPRALISAKGLHFCSRQLESVLAKYSVRHHLTTTCHPQMSDQAKFSNHEIQQILDKTVNPNRKDWSTHLNNPLWAYRTAYKTPFEMSLSIECQFKSKNTRDDD